ncbi:DUF4293 domain-containing protein [Bacteroides sp. 519]|uniref:DUF4293 domain-containing protein n=1 Tax=Bacteroides sp. 519 TaxID=2302937 RepID=UPI0013D052BD|nr:DUF4293 domain-containing protein [Bacteroides sp. 519]NDV59776.1 DUF4293 family protein [Bacteroides sp. 519]
MIQRIQTVYLLCVVGLLITSMFLPLGFFIDTDAIAYTFTPFGIDLKDSFHSSWGIFAILLLSSIIAAATIFIYKNRVLQIRFSIFNSILLIGYYLVFVAFFFALKDNFNDFRINWALCLPLIAIIFNYLAIRAIGKDEVMVKAADRLR